MHDTLKERISHLFQESRYCEIRKIISDSSIKLFPENDPLTPDQNDVILLYCLSMKELGYYRKPHRLLYYATKKNPGNALLLEYAQSCLERQNVVKALKILDQTRETKSPDEERVLKLCALYAWAYAVMGAFESAESSIARASEYATPKTCEYLAVAQSRVLRLNGDWEKSELSLVSHLAERPEDFYALYRLAFVQVQSGKWDTAIKHYTHAIKIKPESFLPVYELGYLFLKTAHYSEAYESLLNAYNLSPDNDFSQSLAWGIGFSLFQMNQREKALSWFRKAKSDDMIKACLNLELGKKEERIEIRVPFHDVLTETDPYSEDITLQYLSAYWKKEISTDQDRNVSLISAFRNALEERGLVTRSFVATAERIIRLLKLNAPVVVLRSNFEGRHYSIITGYNSITEDFILLEDAGNAEYSQGVLFDMMRSTDYWALAVFPHDLEDQMRFIIPPEEDERFRILEKAEEDLFYQKLSLAKKRIESLPPGQGYMMRLRLLHSLRKAAKPAASLTPTLNIILKASNFSVAELGFAAREYFIDRNYGECLSVAKKAILRSAPAPSFLCAQSALELDNIALCLRYNACGLSLAPSDVDLIIQRGIAYRRIFEYREAFRFFRIAQESAPDYPKVSREIGETYRLLRDFNNAEHYLKLSLEANPQDGSSWQILLSVYEDQFRFQSAELTCQNALRQNPDAEWAFLLASNFHIQQSLFPEALAILEEGLSTHPDSLQMNLTRLEIFEMLGEIDKAEKEYRSLMKKFKAHKSILTHYALFLTNQERYEEASPLFENVILEDPDFQPAIIGLARWRALQNNLQISLDLVKRSLTIGKPDPELITFLYRLCIPLDAVKEGAHFLISLSRDFSGYLNAGYLFEITDEFDPALRLYKKAQTLQKHNPQPIYRIAQIHHKRGDLDEALRCYEETLALDPRFDAALEGLALLDLERDDVQSAMGRLEQILSVFPDHERAQELYLEIAETRQQCERSRTFLDALSSKTENTAHFALLIGKIAEAENNFDLASHYYNQSLELDDAYPPSYLHLAHLEIKRKNLEISRSLLDKCVSIQSNIPDVFLLRSNLWQKLGKKNLAVKDCCKSMELIKTDDDMDMEPFDLLAQLLNPGEIDRYNLEKNYRVSLPDQFYCLMGGAFERKGDLKTARLLYEASDPFNPKTSAFEAIIGLTYIARDEDDSVMLDRIREYLRSLLDESETHPETYSPIEQANLREAIAFIEEGERSLNELKESLRHWRYALKITRSPWSLEHAAYACLDLGELTGDESYFREAIVYLRELRNFADVQSPYSPALGDACYFLHRYQDAVREYNAFFNLEERDPSLQPVFFRYLDAMEKIHSPVSDITELAVQKLESLPSDRVSDSYRNALQDRIFHNYVRTRQHRAALRTAIRAKGFFKGVFRYFKSFFRSESAT